MTIINLAHKDEIDDNNNWTINHLTIILIKNCAVCDAHLREPERPRDDLFVQ